jgi:hypothetical protein
MHMYVNERRMSRFLHENWILFEDIIRDNEDDDDEKKTRR